MNRKGKLLVALVILITLIIFGIVSNIKNKKAEQPIVEEQIILARFECANSSFIDAKFNNGESKSVELTFSDERKFNLPQAISASGARYANADESIVFWNKGDTAFIEEGGRTTYTDCLVKTENPTNPISPNIVGGDVDAHGCLPSAGYSWCEVKNKCLRTWEEPCVAQVNSATKLNIKNETVCEKNNGVWYTDNNTCEINSYSKTECLAKGGVYNECASACRHDPGAQMCTMQCVMTCSFN